MFVPFAISASLGPLLLGVILNAILYGICVVQCFIYYQSYRSDAKWIRYFVLILFIMETCNMVLDIGIVFEPLVLHFGDPIAFKNTPTIMFTDSLSTVLITTLVQYFIAWRIKVVSQSWIMPIIIFFLGTASIIGGFVVSILTIFIHEREKLPRVEPALITWLASSAAADLLITLSLSYALFKRKTGMKRTDDKVTRMIMLTIQTGCLTTIFALADVIVFLIIPKTNINFVFDFAISKICTNSLLCTLNARAGWANFSNTANNADANFIFGQIGQISSRMPTDFDKSTVMSTSLMQSRAVRADEIELNSKASYGSPGDFENGVRVHKVVTHF